jgi:small subunit ribosomal protein S3
MGQKVSPVGFRTGVTSDWKSRWFAPKSNYGEFLVEDQKIRQYIDKKLNQQPPFAAIAQIDIERTREEVKVVLRTARPGLVIGPRGSEVDKLKAELENLTDRRVNVNIIEVKNPDLNAQLAALGISEQLKRRSSFRRTMKQRCESAMNAGAKGVKITVSGRLGGAEMSRTETQILGSIPLQTLEADVDYGCVHCFTTYGALGVKVWIYRGMMGAEDRVSDESSASGDRTTRSRRRMERRRGGGGPKRETTRTQTPSRFPNRPTPGPGDATAATPGAGETAKAAEENKAPAEAEPTPETQEPDGK